MADDTGLTQLDFVFHRLFVAAMAIEPLMLTRQRVFGLLIVIKQPRLPIRRRMA